MNEQNLPEFIFPDDLLPKETSEPVAKTSSGDQSTLMLQILRALGAIIIVAAASIFLFQHWGVGSDVQRYLLLLAFTGILSVGGFFCALQLKESKGARTLLGLTLAVTPVNFAVLGGLIYSRFSWDDAFLSVPGYATWVAPSPTSALLTAAGALLVLAPLCYLSFLSLARHQAKLLAGGFFLSNLALLFPSRQPNWIGVMAALLVIGLTCFEVRRFAKEASLKTFEGRFSRLLLWVPPAMLIGRTFHLYAPTQLFTACLLAASAILGFVFLPPLARKDSTKRLLQGLSMVPASCSLISLADLFYRAFSLSSQWTIPLCTLPTAVLLVAASWYAIGSGTGYRRAAALIALAGTSVNLLIFPGLTSSLVCLITALAILICGFMVEQKIMFFSGAAGVIFGLGYHLKYALNLYSLLNWGSLAVIGMAIIIFASLLERHQEQLRERIRQFRSRLQHWSH